MSSVSSDTMKLDAPRAESQNAAAPAVQAQAASDLKGKAADSTTAQTPTDGKDATMAVMPAIGSDEAAGFNRKLIYRANLVMPVDDYGKLKQRSETL